MNVLVDSLGNYSVDVLVLDLNIEKWASAKSEHKSFIVLAKVEVDFGSDEGGELSVRESLIFVKDLDLGNSICNLGPELVYQRVETLERIRLELGLLLIEQSDDTRCGCDWGDHDCLKM